MRVTASAASITAAFAALPLALAFSLPAAAQQTLVADKSEIRFVSKQMGVPVEGRFKKFTGTLAFDPNKPEASKAEFSVDLNSIDVGDADTVTESKRKLWFDTAVFPQAKFVSGTVKSLGGGKYEVAGKLSIKGISKDVVAPFTIKQEGANTVADGQFTMKRLEFKIGEGQWADTATVADEVQVKFKMTMAGVPAAKK